MKNVRGLYSIQLKGQLGVKEYYAIMKIFKADLREFNRQEKIGEQLKLF